MIPLTGLPAPGILSYSQRRNDQDPASRDLEIVINQLIDHRQRDHRLAKVRGPYQEINRIADDSARTARLSLGMGVLYIAFQSPSLFVPNISAIRLSDSRWL